MPCLGKIKYDHYACLDAEQRPIGSMFALTGRGSFISFGSFSVVVPSCGIPKDSFALGWNHPNLERVANLGGSFGRKTPPINRFLIETPIASNLESRYFALLD
jgi:hypothetical protein